MSFEGVLMRRGYLLHQRERSWRFTVDTGAGAADLAVIAIAGLEGAGGARERVPRLREEAARAGHEVQELWHPDGCVLFSASGDGAATLLDVLGADAAIADALLDVGA